MRRPIAPLCCLLAVVCSSLSSGCYHMYSQPYGGYTGAPAGAVYPGSMPYQAPIQTLTPGAPYTPGTTYQAAPGGTTPTYQNPSGGLQPIPETSAPSYNSTTTPSTTPNSNPKTPDPYFPNTFNAPSSGGLNSVQPAAYTAPAPLGPPAAGLREVTSGSIDYVPAVNSAGVKPLGGEMAAPTPAAALLPVETQAETAQFAPPVMSPPPGKTAAAASLTPLGAEAVAPVAAPVTPAAAESLWDVQTKKVVTADVAVFAHDPKFQWLRGVVSRDPKEGTWSVVYADAPGADDKWAGHLSLAPSPQLDQLKDGDVVELHGQIDDVVQDRLGKPVYVVSSLKKPFEK